MKGHDVTFASIDYFDLVLSVIIQSKPGMKKHQILID